MRAAHTPPTQRMRSERACIEVTFDVALQDIAAPSACPNCGGTRQREFVQWETVTDTLTITAGAAPGYGCTDCGAKFLPPGVAMPLYEAAARGARAAGDDITAQRLESRADAVGEGPHTNVG